jgi:predicted nucleotidyltransferase
MRAVGLITEYNPFHNGHAYHVREARHCSGAEVVVAAMGGHFLQRGEPALVDKWRRARMALSGGVDVVVELPFPWACNSAPHFAAGALEVLHAFYPHLDSFCFGSESDDLGRLRKIAASISSLEQDEDGFSMHFRDRDSYPAARQKHLVRRGAERSTPEECATHEELNAPNNILAIAYLRALAAAEHINLEPRSIKRIGAGFHEREAGKDNIASATGVRHMLAQGHEVHPYVPEVSAQTLAEAQERKLICCPQRWFTLSAGACLRQSPAEEDIYQYQPGLQQRALHAALEAKNHAELVSYMKARHLTRTRVQRLLCYTTLGVTRAEMESQLQQEGIPFLILLGASVKGEEFLRQCRKDMPVPLVRNFSRIDAILKRHYRGSPQALARARNLLDLHNRTTRMYTLLLPGWKGRSRHMDYVCNPLRPGDSGAAS